MRCSPALHTECDCNSTQLHHAAAHEASPENVRRRHFALAYLFAYSRHRTIDNVSIDLISETRVHPCAGTSRKHQTRRNSCDGHSLALQVMANREFGSPTR